MKYNRFLPIIVPFLTIIFLEIFFFFPKMLYVVLVMLFLLFFFASRQLSLASPSKEKWYKLLIQPAVFTAGIIVFCTMIPSKTLVQCLFVVDIVFLYFYFTTIYYRLLRPDCDFSYSLENLSSYGNFLSFYFLASSIYGLQVYLQIQTWLLMIFLIFFTGLIVYQVFWANRITTRFGFIYILIISLVLVELAWAASFLTLSYYVLGLILAVCYYILIGLVRFYLLGKIDKKIIKLYLIFGLSSILIVLLTARWM